MRIVGCLLLPLLGSSVAHAEADDISPASTGPKRDGGYLAASYSLHYTAADALFSFVNVEGALRLGKTPVVLRALFGRGDGRDGGEDTRTDLSQARLGVEIDSCTNNRRICVFGGFDAGRLWAHTNYLDDFEMDTDTTESITVGRLGFDAGGSIARFRLAVNVGGKAGGLELALSHRFE